VADFLAFESHSIQSKPYTFALLLHWMYIVLLHHDSIKLLTKPAKNSNTLRQLSLCSKGTETSTCNHMTMLRIIGYNKLFFEAQLEVVASII
jgi:hypothetical protein